MHQIPYCVQYYERDNIDPSLDIVDFSWQQQQVDNPNFDMLFPDPHEQA